MKKIVWMAIALSGVGITVHAQTSVKDSMRVVNLQEVQVVSTRATAKTPVAFTNIGKAELKKVNFGQDIPYLLSMTPSTLTTSDAGAGIGYTTLRVRGTDGTRINITVNGIPMNDAESHNLFWVNMPDFSSSVKDMQVQRGAGTSTNGAGAFGASVNMQTEGASMKPYAEFNGSYGSFNTHKETVKVGTGLLNNHWTFDARLSNIGTDGYIDRASVDLNSYYLQGGYFAENTSVKLIAFAGKEKTYHAWGYATKKEMEDFGRRYNPCGEMYTDANGNKHFYDDQTDNYLQKNYQLLFNHTFSTAWNLNVALHYTKGDGYYEEYKDGRSLIEYGLKPFTIDGTEITKSDLVRQKKMDNKFGGGVFSLNYTVNRLNASLGGGLNQYRGNNFGRVPWVKNYVGTLSPDHEYYRNKSQKTDGNIYLKANYDLTSGLSAYADLQYRHIDYTIDGNNDKYDWSKNALRPLAVDKKFDFFNPKVGLNWNITSNHRVYASFSVAQKEPTRNNYTDGDPDSYPKAEKLLDYEAGYTFANQWLTAGANFYYMDYTDQLVLTGALNDIGEALTENVPDSYRMGVELMLGIKPCKWFQWDINATWSKNRIQDFVESLPGYHYNEDGSSTSLPTVQIKHKDTHIAFSPDFLFNNRFSFNYKRFEAALQSQFVSKQYMTNTEVEALTLDKYFVSNLNLAYSFRPKKVLKEVTVGFTVYNLFNEKYENNGWASSDYTDTVENRGNYAGYAAQAGTNVMGHVSFRF
ncbi:TonB-dependent receptor [Bacteroides sp.]|uniref:TonB-dependent receptor n=1 Tax=Bacteroides sp. TaxID=29523 RepID=UPI001EB74F2C|nr:TonB-dependent receptor [Bacteroides sp.]MBS5057118.1 TonB-dependent receptor [Bacteroides sp.]